MKFLRHVPKLADRDIVKLFEYVAGEFSGKNIKVVFKDALGDVGEDGLSAYREGKGFLLNSAHLVLGSYNVWRLERGAPELGADAVVYDRFEFENRNGQYVVGRDIFLSLSNSFLSGFAKKVVRSASDGELRASGEVTATLQSVAASVIEESVAHRATLEASFLAREKAMEERLDQERVRELERISAEKERVEAELEKRRSEIDSAQAVLDAKQKVLDDRNNTHVRREIRESLLALAKDRLDKFSLSKETNRHYWVLNIASVVSIVALGVGAFAYGFNASSEVVDGSFTAVGVSSFVKSGVMAAALVALGYWYLKWLNRWLQRIADAEFRLQQFRLDVERASWLAETVLEWKNVSADPFPDLLVSRLSAGLFQSSKEDIEDPKTPAGHLAEALLGSAASARLKFGEQEVNLDRKSIKGLSG